MGAVPRASAEVAAQRLSAFAFLFLFEERIANGRIGISERTSRSSSLFATRHSLFALTAPDRDAPGHPLPEII